jgi:hypothetical protein
MGLAAPNRIARVLAIVSLVIMSARASAAPPPTTTAPSRLQPGTVHVHRGDAWLGFDTDYEWQRVKYHGSDRARSRYESRDLLLREVLGLQLLGDVVDPALLEWKADLELGLEQERFDEDAGRFDDTGWDTGFLQNYDVSIDALKDKPVSFHAYARRGDNRIPRLFLPSLHEEATEAGVSALAVFGSVTTEIGYTFSDVDRTGNRFDVDDENLRTSRFYADTKWEISEDQTLKVSFEHERQESVYQGSAFDFDTRRNEVRLDHELAFGAKKKHRVETYFRYNEEQGDLARDELELVPRLMLQHTDKLRTVYRYGFYRFEQDALKLDQHKLDAEILYEATKHLRVSLDGYGLYERADDDVDAHEFGTGLDVAYDRPTSLGELSINASLYYDYAQTKGDAGKRFVFDEVHTFESVRLVYLKHRGALPLTIVAHNGTRTRVYAQGLDYTVTMISGRARLRRVPTGRIAEGETIYFDYAYVIPAHRTLNAQRTGLSVEHAFDFGLTPYYYLETRCEEVDASDGAPWGRDNMHRHRLGAKFDRDWWRICGEIEIFDDTIEPYNAFHLTGGANLFRSSAHSLDVSGELSRYDFDGGIDDRDVWWLDLALDDRMQINDYLSVVTEFRYRWEDDSVDRTTNGLDVERGLCFKRGYLKVELTVEYDVLSIADDRDDGLGVYLRVRRDIPGLLTASRDAR